MAVGEQRDQHAIDQVLLADNDLADLSFQIIDELKVPFYLSLNLSNILIHVLLLPYRLSWLTKLYDLKPATVPLFFSDRRLCR